MIGLAVIDEKQDEDEVTGYQNIQHLLQFGKKKTFVTIGDVLKFFPDGENDFGKLEEAFDALVGAGIPYVENDSDGGEPTDADLAKEEESRNSANSEEDYLANIPSDDSIGLYMKEVGRVPLLKSDEEVLLSKTIERGKMAREELASGEIKEKRRGQLIFLIEKGQEARDHLINANSRLVVSIAKRFRNRGVPFLDLIQEGSIGLMRAVKKFDYRRGFKFSTYATWWIRQAISRSVADNGRTIRLPVHMGDRVSKYLRVLNQLKQNLHREPTDEEASEVLDIPLKETQYLKKVARRSISFETPVGDDGERVLGDFINDDKMPAPEEAATQRLMKEHLAEVLEKLPSREARIIQLRFGLNDGRQHTLAELGKKFGVTRERIRQICAQALKELRQPKIRLELQDYLN